MQLLCEFLHKISVPIVSVKVCGTHHQRRDAAPWHREAGYNSLGCPMVCRDVELLRRDAGCIHQMPPLVCRDVELLRCDAENGIRQGTSRR